VRVSTSCIRLNTAIALQAQSQETGGKSIDQVTDRFQVVSAIGEVSDDGTVDSLTLRVRLAPGSDPIDLSTMTVQTVGDGVDANQSVEVVDSSDAVLGAGGDIGYVRVYGDDGVDGGGLAPGDRVSARITTGAGATTVHVVDVPDTLAGKSVVEL
jgi:flagellin FlaB